MTNLGSNINQSINQSIKELYLSTAVIKAKKLMGPFQKEIQKEYKTTIIVQELVLISHANA